MLRLVPVLSLMAAVAGQCSHERAIAIFKQPTYEFSVSILYRVAEDSDYHFVFSPISTWLQLITLAAGAKGETEREIQTVIHHKNPCLNRKYLEVMNNLGDKDVFTRSSLIVLNNLIRIKKAYKSIVRRYSICKMRMLNFGNPRRAAETINRIVETDTNGKITEAVYFDDFNRTLMLLTDNGYFRSTWLYPFNPVYTSTEPFYLHDTKIGEVRMMSQLGYFNIADVPSINAQVLELPFNTRRAMSMLVLLPKKQTLQELFYSFRNIRLRTIFSLMKSRRKLALVKLPRFKIETELDNLPEILYDMGIKSIFYPELASFGKISDYKLFVSLVTQIAKVEVTEEGARAGYLADFQVNANQTTDFNANRPFAFLIVDRTTEVILFAGMYSEPSVY